MKDLDRLTPADPKDVVFALQSALSTSGRNRIPGARIMARIVADRLVAELLKSNFVIMPGEGAATLGRGFEKPKQEP